MCLKLFIDAPQVRERRRNSATLALVAGTTPPVVSHRFDRNGIVLQRLVRPRDRESQRPREIRCTRVCAAVRLVHRIGVHRSGLRRGSHDEPRDVRGQTRALVLCAVCPTVSSISAQRGWRRARRRDGLYVFRDCAVPSVRRTTTRSATRFVCARPAREPRRSPFNRAKVRNEQAAPPRLSRLAG
jgi:hypothetical protein